MRWRLVVGLLATSFCSSSCSSPDARDALVEAAAATVLAVGAAAVDAAARQDPEHEAARKWNQRPHHVPEEPGVWRLIRNPDGEEECDPEQDDECTSEEPENEASEPFIETGKCMVCSQ